jgi:Ca-activated chloride channel family protein
VFLSVLGYGMGNYKDSKIQTLARKGNGNFAYLDNFKEAEKVLMKEFTGTLYAVADDVYMDVEFNPQYVKDYRLIGYDNKVGALADSLSVIEGGEIGSGQSLLTVFFIVPEQSNKEVVSNLTGGRFADIKLDYKHSNDSTNCHYIYPSRRDLIPFDKIDRSYRFSASVIMFGSLLRFSPTVKNLTWNDMVAWATSTAR